MAKRDQEKKTLKQGEGEREKDKETNREIKDKERDKNKEIGLEKFFFFFKEERVERWEHKTVSEEVRVLGTAGCF